jgi:hypothetical protein
VGVDTAVIPQFSSGTASVSATGAVGTFYAETDRPAFYTYPATDAETVLLSLPAGTGSSGGVPYFTATADVIASSAALTANLPVIGGGAGAAPAVGTRSGNTTAYVTTTGTQTSGDCVKIDASGNHIANGSACGGGFDPSTSISMVEEFAGGTLTSGQLGTLGWRSAAISTGTLVGGTSAASHPTVMNLNSHATNDNSGYEVYLSQDDNGSGLGKVSWDGLTTGDWTLDVLFKPNSVTSVALWIGFTTGTPDAVSGGAWIRFDTDKSDTKYVFQICNNSAASGCPAAGDDTSSKTTLSTVTASAAWTRGRIRFDATGTGGNPTWYFRINDETELDFCSSGCSDTLGTLPTGATGRPTVTWMTRTTTGVQTLQLDYWAFQASGMTRY